MNKLISILALCSLVLAPGCGFLHKSCSSQPCCPSHKKVVEKERQSGPAGWNIDLDKE